MGTDVIKVTEEVVSCSDNGQHPLVYISLKNGEGSCQYCGQVFVRVKNDDDRTSQQEAA
ncbi:MAG: zinc-finger domain-containing protein [Mariprofundaceae bacterium]